MGLSSVTTLIVGNKAAVIIDPPFLIPDAKSVISFVKARTSVPVSAVFVTHHHCDHYFSANPILEAFPNARFLAHAYVIAAINREYDEKVVYWPKVFGAENVPANPRKPEPYDYSFFVLPGNEISPICLLGPVQGASIDHTVFWLPTEKVVMAGDTIYCRSTHVWVEEVDTEAILSAWRATLDLISALNPATIVPGHVEAGWQPDANKDLEHMYKYLDLFENKIMIPEAEGKPRATVEDIFQTFKEAFPQCRKNLDFFLGKLSNRFGANGKEWAENRAQDVASRRTESLEGFILRA